MPTSSTELLLNPRSYDPAHFDAETRRLLRATIDWLEAAQDRAWAEVRGLADAYAMNP